MELLQTDTPRENLFEATASALKEQGIRLRTSEEVESDTTVGTIFCFINYLLHLESFFHQQR